MSRTISARLGGRRLEGMAWNMPPAASLVRLTRSAELAGRAYGHREIGPAESERSLRPAASLIRPLAEPVTRS